MRTRIIMALTLTAALATTAAIAMTGNDDPTGDSPAGACLEGSLDCADDPSQGDGADFGDQYDSEAARERARDLLGLAEVSVPDDVRVGRRGDDQYMLTEDYVLGRMTVELDDDGTGTFRVTAVVVELPDGPETIAA